MNFPGGSFIVGSVLCPRHFPTEGFSLFLCHLDCVERLLPLLKA